MEGRVEGVSQGVLTGWVRDEREPERHVAIDLMVNERTVGTFVADAARPDLASEGAGDHGFEIEVLAEWLKDGKNVLTVWTRPEGILVRKPVSHRHPKRRPVVTAPPAPEATPAPPPPVVAGAARAEVKYLDRPSPPGQVGPQLVDPAGLQIVLDAVMADRDEIVPTLERIVDRLFRKRLWHEVITVCTRFRDEAWEQPRLLGWYGRALLYARDSTAAGEALLRLRELQPDRHGDVFYLALALGRQGRWREALEVLEDCISRDPRRAKYHYEAGRALTQLGFGAYGLLPEDRTAIQRAVDAFETALEVDDRDWRYYRELSALLLSLGDGERAYELARTATERAPTEPRALTELAKICVRLDRIPEALEAAQQALKLNPRNDTSKFNLRLITRLSETAGPSPDASLAELDATGGLHDALLAEPATWVVLDAAAVPDGCDVQSLVTRFGFAWGAGVRPSEDADPVVWRRSFLLALLSAKIVPRDAGAAELARRAALHGQFVVAEPDIRRRLHGSFSDRRTVLLFSQYGIRRFGGGEHFLQQMAHLYRRLGFEPVVVGTEPERKGEYGEHEGLRYLFIDRSPDEILRLAIEERATLVHVISGLAFDVAMSLRAFDIRVVHGVHSWRDMYTPTTTHDGYFPDIDRSSAKRPEFDVVLQDAAAVYANADFSRAEIEKAYGVRAPVIYSLPDDVEAAAPAPEDYVLLVNTRSEKGFDLILDVAARLPDRQFRAISSQSSGKAAGATVLDRGLSNVTILDRVDDVAPLYAKARVVAVPSYQFIETFSRVVIEAQRFGVPVIGSDRGNVPYLLQESGIALPEDAEAWAEEIERLFADDEEWARRSALAFENSERYAFRRQEAALSRLVSGIAAPILVGVGSGLGNIIHTTPLLRNLARRLGRPVDLVVAGDHESLLFIPSNGEYVNHTFLLTENVLNRRYDTVFLTNSFGSLVPRFASSNIVSSRSWDTFHAGHELHEAEFNLAAAEALLGVPYDPEDIQGYYIADLDYRPPAQALVGMHAGSKGGIWGSKRWPHYAELARRLQRDGFTVASFGIAEEYVEGTIDMTGGSIEEMATSLLACSHFVANDSGVMNIANALGIPVRALFAPTNPVTRGPVTSTGSSIFISRECAPCEVKTPYRTTRFLSGECNCIDAIDVETVYESVLEMLRSPVGV
jgi:glycosyltransferase involved in cell wall biosynthesis